MGHPKVSGEFRPMEYLFCGVASGEFRPIPSGEYRPHQNVFSVGVITHD